MSCFNNIAIGAQGDLTDLTSIPATMVGVHTVIDCATARPEESTDKVDWQGKVALIQSAQVQGLCRSIEVEESLLLLNL